MADPDAALAYGGPGSVISGIGALLAAIAAVGAAIFGFFWFFLLFVGGVTSCVALATPSMAFLQEEFDWERKKASYSIMAVAFTLGLAHVVFYQFGFMNEWDYWAGTFGLVVFATIEVILFMWVYGRDRAWRSLHEGADLQIPVAFKWIMAVVTPAYLLFILGWWGVTDALPILVMAVAAGGGPVLPEATPYVIVARVLLVAMTLGFLWLIRLAWKRNGYRDRDGLLEVQSKEVATI